MENIIIYNEDLNAIYIYRNKIPEYIARRSDEKILSELEYQTLLLADPTIRIVNEQRKKI